MDTNRSNPQFLSGESIRERLQALIREADKMDAAVAYWGEGAVELLGLNNKEKGAVRVICDARSGACNPWELRKLLGLLGGGQLKALDGLHAKVYVTPSSALVGSANASANGLGEECAEIKSGHEACIFTRQEPEVSQIVDWFEEHWTSPEAQVIDEVMLSSIERLWVERRRGRPARSPSYTTLLEQIHHKPEFFKDRRIRLILYESADLSASAKKIWKEKKNLYYHETVLHEYEKNDVLPFYEDITGWSIAPNDIVVDFYFDAKGAVLCGGVWRVRSEGAFVPIIGKSRARLILLDELTRPYNLEFSESDHLRLAGLIAEYVKDNKVSINSDGNFIDKPLDEMGTILARYF